jgi:hypothetical protein
MSEWKCLLEDGAQMEGTFLDVVLRHCAFRVDHDVRCQYHFTHNWISRNLHMQLNTEGRTWDAVGALLSKVLRSSTGWENTLVVPYHNKDHWSIFVIELSRTYHLDLLPGLHSGRYVKNFIFLSHMGWALAKGVVIGSDPWHSILKRQPFEVPAPKQQENWECGYAACMMFWQFIIERGSWLESDVNLLFVKDNWIQWNGVFLQRWALQVVYTKIVYPYPDFDVPEIGAKKIDIVDLDDDDVQVIGTPQGFRKATSALGLEQHVEKKQISKMQVVKDTWLKVVRKKKQG